MSHNDGFTHPLMRKPIGSASSPTELLEEWTQEMARDVPEAGGLEGVLYRVASFPSEDVILLCLDIADGYRMSEYDFRLPGERESRYPDPGELRSKVSRKAFWALCEGVFKDKRERHAYLPSWAELVVQERIFKKILWFIFDEERRSDRDTNLPFHPGSGSLAHQENIFRQFVVGLVDFAWNFRGLNGRWGDDDKLRAEMFHRARPELIRVLYKVGNLDTLKRLASLDPAYGNRGLDGRERRILRELAIGRAIAGASGEGIWKMIETEVAEGNTAAEFLWCYLPRVKRLRHELSQKRGSARKADEKRKKQAREALERKAAEAQAQLQALSSDS